MQKLSDGSCCDLFSRSIKRMQSFNVQCFPIMIMIMIMRNARIARFKFKRTNAQETGRLLSGRRHIQVARFESLDPTFLRAGSLDTLEGVSLVTPTPVFDLAFRLRR